MVPGVVSRPTKLTHPNVVVNHLVGAPTRTRWFAIMTGCFTGARIGVHATCFTNLHRGIMERIFYVKDENGQFISPPQPTARFHFPSFTLHIRKVCGIINPYSYDEFLGCYVARKRKDYERARDEVLLGRLRRSHAFIRAFGKVEKTDFGAKPDAVQRVVSPRDKRYNISVGRFIKAMEHPIYHAIDALFGSPTVMKCLNYQDRAAAAVAKWSKFRRPVAIRADAKRFDQHVSCEALDWEHSVYLSLCPKPFRMELARLLSWQKVNKGYVYMKEGVIKYTRKGTRASGDMNTGLGNILIMCSLLWEFRRRFNLQFELLDDGDDYVILCDRAEEKLIYENIHAYFLSYGFEMDVARPVYEFSKLVFCQTQPIWDGEDWLMVRSPHMGLIKDTSTMLVDEFVRKGQLVSQPKILTTIGKGGLSLAQGIPIYDTLYRRFIELGHGCDCDKPGLMSGFLIHAKKMGHIRSNKTITPESRLSFSDAFGIEPAMQQLIEERIKVWNPLLSLKFATNVSWVDLVAIPI